MRQEALAKVTQFAARMESLAARADLTLKGGERDYNGLEFVFRKRFADRWQLPPAQSKSQFAPAGQLCAQLPSGQCNVVTVPVLVAVPA